MKARRIPLLLILIAGILCLPAAAHEGLEEQVEQLTRRIEREPRNVDLYVRRGELFRQLRQWKSAQSDYDRAHEIDPALVEIGFFRGRMWFEAGRPANARAALDVYLKLKPSHVEALLTRARVLEQQKEFRASVADYSRAIDLTSRPTPDHYIERARVQIAAGALQESLTGLDGAIAKLGPIVALQSQAIEIELRLKHWDAALSRVDQIAAQSARKETYLEQRGEILTRAGRTREARMAFTEALKAIESLPQHLRQTRAMADLERRTRAALL